MSKPKGFNPQKLMRQAIEVMRSSVAEPRLDGKASPKVGAVLVKPDGSIETAYRGELRLGDHAEFTLLERKNRDVNLADSILFATLEPCAPNARRPPKLGCAERIVLARIKEVWVGIADPDPTVDRKGIKYLQDAGIEVHMFDLDLQEIIRQENRAFIEQALERAAEAETKPQEIRLSMLEDTIPEVNFESLSTEALNTYRRNASITEEITAPAFVHRLSLLGLGKLENERFLPTRNGFLLFGKEPRLVMQQAGVLGTLRFADGTQEIKNFEGPQVLVPEQALEWIQTKLPNPISRSTARRQDINAAYFELAREAIVNAIVHRDYTIAGAKCQLEVTPDRIVVKSPGLPVEPITLEDIQSFTAPMLSRNPVLHYVFAQTQLAEERGLGLKSMRDTAQAAGLPLPRYSWENPYLVVTIYRNVEGAASNLEVSMSESLNADERRGVELLVTKDRVTSKEYAAQMGFDTRKAQRHLKRFVELGILRQVGTASATAYEVLKRG